MPDLPISVEQPIPVPKENPEASIPRFETPTPPETLARAETPQTTEEKVDVALPPELQPEAVVANPAETKVVSTTPSIYINKGKTRSNLTSVAVATFLDLQRKLALHYQKLKTQVGAR